MTDTSNALVPLKPAVPGMTLTEMTTVGRALAQSGFFKDARSAEQALAKILYGAELGVAPVSAMTGIYIIEGKPSLSAALMATLIRRSGRYDYRVTRIDENGCALDFYERGQKIGGSSFTRQDAETAGLLGGVNWKKYFRNMAFARALSNGAHWYCPDVFAGSPVCTPDEMNVEVDESGVPLGDVAIRQPNEPTFADSERARKYFWTIALKQSDDGLAYPSKRAVHGALGIELRDGALGEWVADGRSWPEALAQLQGLGRYTPPSGPVVDTETGEILADAANREPLDIEPCSVAGCGQSVEGFGPEAEPLCVLHLAQARQAAAAR